MKKVPGLVFGVLLFAVPKAGANITVRLSTGASPLEARQTNVNRGGRAAA